MLCWPCENCGHVFHSVYICVTVLQLSSVHHLTCHILFCVSEVTYRCQKIVEKEAIELEILDTVNKVQCTWDDILQCWFLPIKGPSLCDCASAGVLFYTHIYPKDDLALSNGWWDTGLSEPFHSFHVCCAESQAGGVPLTACLAAIIHGTQ